MFDNFATLRGSFGITSRRTATVKRDNRNRNYRPYPCWYGNPTRHIAGCVNCASA